MPTLDVQFEADPDPVDADKEPDATTPFFKIWTLQCSKMTL